jgi:hypothetical protein
VEPLTSHRVGEDEARLPAGQCRNPSRWRLDFDISNLRFKISDARNAPRIAEIDHSHSLNHFRSPVRVGAKQLPL